jgi:hypothetical protein
MARDTVSKQNTKSQFTKTRANIEDALIGEAR